MALEQFYSFVQSALGTNLTMGLEDLMNTSWEDLMILIETSEKKEQEEIIDISEFFG